MSLRRRLRQRFASRSTPDGVGSQAKKAPFNAPTEAPITTSGEKSARLSACSMPTWTAPRLPPPLSTNAVLILAIALRIPIACNRAPEPCLRCPLDVRGGPSVPATHGLRLIVIRESEERDVAYTPWRGWVACNGVPPPLSFLHPLFQMFHVVPRKH